MKIVIAFIFVFLSVFLFGQAEIDSLDNRLKEDLNESDRVDLLMRLGKLTSKSQPQKALKSYNEIIAISKGISDNKKIAEALSKIGWVYIGLNELDSATYYYHEAEELSASIGDQESALTYKGMYISYILYQSHRADESLKLALDLYDKYKNHKEPALEFVANSILYQVYYFIEDRDHEMVQVAERNMDLAKELQDSAKIYQSLFRLAQSYSWIGEQRKSINYYKQLIPMQLKARDYRVSASYNNMANRYKFLGLRDSAIYYFEKAKFYSYKEGRMEGVAASNLYLGREYLHKEDYDKAIFYGLKSLDNFKEAKVLRRQHYSALLLYEGFKGKKQYNNALKYLELSLELKDSSMSKEMEQNLLNAERDFQFKLEQRADSLEFAHQEEIREKQIENEKQKSFFLFIGLGAVALFAILIFNRFRVTKKQKDIIVEQKSIVSEKNREILDSIEYAKRIQNAILPPKPILESMLPEHFVLYKPKDIVAGDFYWLEAVASNVSRVPIGDHSSQATRHNPHVTVLIAAADCTGHGVPGAMVSVVCNNGLNRSVREFGLTDPGKVLDKTRELVIQEFEKSEEEVKDGMDIALLNAKFKMHTSTSRNAGNSKCVGADIQFSGAHNPLWVVRRESAEIEEIKGDKQPVGKFRNAEPFSTKEVSLNTGDTIYIFTDGYVDQFGGEKGKKLKSSNFKKLLISIQNQSMDEQKQHLDEFFETWRGENEQLDDVCVIGIRI